jgi:hypothetical protein
MQPKETLHAVGLALHYQQSASTMPAKTKYFGLFSWLEWGYTYNTRIVPSNCHARWQWQEWHCRCKPRQLTICRESRHLWVARRPTLQDHAWNRHNKRCPCKQARTAFSPSQHT